MNKLYPWPAVAATSATAAVLYVLCTLLVLLFPLGTVKILGSMFHGIDLTKIIATTITFPSFLKGLIVLILLTGLSTFLVVLIYNACVAHCRKRGWIAENNKEDKNKRISGRK